MRWEKTSPKETRPGAPRKTAAVAHGRAWLEGPDVPAHHVTPRHPKHPNRSEPGAESLAPKRRAAALGFVAIIAASSVVAIAHAWTGHLGGAFWFWAAACFAAELLWVPMPFGNATLSMASACNFAAVLLLPRGEAMMAAAAAGLIADACLRRKAPVRCLFNAAQAALAVGGSSWAFAATGHGASESALVAAHTLWPLLAAATAYTAINYGSVSVVVALSTGVPVVEAWRRNFWSAYEQISNAALFSLGIMIALLHQAGGPLATSIAAVPLVLAWWSYRHYVTRARTEGAEEKRAA